MLVFSTGQARAVCIEDAVHAAHLYLKNDIKNNQAIMKVNFKITFTKDKILSVEEFIPNILPFIHCTYSSPSFLYGVIS